MLPIEDSLEVKSTHELRGIYCTIVAQNYLPQALALYASIREVEPGRDFVILVIDSERSDLQTGRPRLSVVSTSVLGLSEREILDLATIYDVVEFSTAVKPLFLKWLLTTHDQAVYLDPDTFLISPLSELEPLLDRWGIVLTPHFLEPIEPGQGYISEIHSLTVGIHNLGFCAVSREGIPFLDWWWSHLERECLIYPLLGVFVDQKWTDIGATLFNAHSLRHYGYNAGPWNLHEREFYEYEHEWVMARTHEPLRLFHFSGFDPAEPDAISARLNFSLKDAGVGSSALSALSHRYAQVMLHAAAALGEDAPYSFDRDSRGKRLNKRIRRAYRKDLIVGGSDHNLPSPFLARDAKAFRRWRKRSWTSRVHIGVSDAAIAIKYVFPDEYSAVKRSLPSQFSRLRARLLRAAQIRR